MNLEKTVRELVIWGIFLIPLIPLIVTNFLYFPFITGKNFTFRILVELLLGGWLILLFYNPIYRPRFSWLLAAILSFVGIIALADIFGENPEKSIWSNFERMEGLVTLLHLLAYFLVVGTMLNTEKLWTRFLNVSSAVSGLVAIYGLIQLSGFLTIHQGGVRLDATFGNATYLAIYMLFHVFLTTFLMLRWKGERYMRYIYGGLILLQVIIIYFTATRGAILGLLGGALLSSILIALFEREQKVIRKTSIGIIVAVFAIVGGFMLVKNSSFVEDSPVLKRFANISLTERTVNARFQIWNLAIEGVKERPLLGWGQENFNFVFNKRYQPELYPQEQWFDRVHNIVFDWLIAGGILGFLAYVSIFLFALLYLWRSKNTFFSVPEKSIFTGLLAGYTFHNLFVFDNIVSYIMFFTVLSLVYWSYKESTKKIYMENMEHQGHTRLVSRMYAPLIIILTLLSVYAINGKGVLAASALLEAVSLPPENSRQLEEFKKALSYDTIGYQEVRERLVQVATIILGRSLGIERNQAYLSLAADGMQEQLNRVPNDARTQIFMGTMLDAYGLYEQALPYLQRAHELSPKKQAISFQLGLNTLNRGDTVGALRIFKEAYELAPSYDDARIFYAVGAVYAEDDELLKEILLPRYGTIVVDNDRLLQAYFNKRKLDRVLAIWELRREEMSENPQVYLGLAATYLEMGRREKSVEEIERAIELNPAFREQGEYLIREIRAGRNP